MEVKNKMLDFKQMAEGARAFSNAGDILKSKFKNECPETEIIPAYVNTAIACELYMKAMIVHKNPNTTEKELKNLSHDLYNIFNKTPLEIQDRVKSKFPDNVVTDNEKSVCDSFNKLLQSSDTPAEVKNIASQRIKNMATSFDKILKKHADIFIDWRYHFVATDSKPIYCDEWFLYTFCIELHNEMTVIMNKV